MRPDARVPVQQTEQQKTRPGAGREPRTDLHVLSFRERHGRTLAAGTTRPRRRRRTARPARGLARGHARMRSRRERPRQLQEPTAGGWEPPGPPRSARGSEAAAGTEPQGRRSRARVQPAAARGQRRDDPARAPRRKRLRGEHGAAAPLADARAPTPGPTGAEAAARALLARRGPAAGQESPRPRSDPRGRTVPRGPAAAVARISAGEGRPGGRRLRAAEETRTATGDAEEPRMGGGSGPRPGVRPRPWPAAPTRPRRRHSWETWRKRWGATRTAVGESLTRRTPPARGRTGTHPAAALLTGRGGAAGQAAGSARRPGESGNARRTWLGGGAERGFPGGPGR